MSDKSNLHVDRQMSVLSPDMLNAIYTKWLTDIYTKWLSAKKHRYQKKYDIIPGVLISP